MPDDKPKLDRLGRRIPQFDRSAAGKKGIKTLKEKYGNDYPARIGATGGRKRTRGHFGKLKAEGSTEEVKRLGSIGGQKGVISRRAKKSPDDSSAPGVRGHETSVSGEAPKKSNDLRPRGISEG